MSRPPYRNYTQGNPNNNYSQPHWRGGGQGRYQEYGNGNWIPFDNCRQSEPPPLFQQCPQSNLYNGPPVNFYSSPPQSWRNSNASRDNLRGHFNRGGPQTGEVNRFGYSSPSYNESYHKIPNQSSVFRGNRQRQSYRPPPLLRNQNTKPNSSSHFSESRRGNRVGSTAEVNTAPKPKVVPNAFSSFVTKVDDEAGVGFIGEDMIYTISAIVGKKPKLGDKVFVEADPVEGMSYHWRCRLVQVIADAPAGDVEPDLVQIHTPPSSPLEIPTPETSCDLGSDLNLNDGFEFTNRSESHNHNPPTKLDAKSKRSGQEINQGVSSTPIPLDNAKEGIDETDNDYALDHDLQEGQICGLQPTQTSSSPPHPPVPFENEPSPTPEPIQIKIEPEDDYEFFMVKDTFPSYPGEPMRMKPMEKPIPKQGTTSPPSTIPTNVKIKTEPEFFMTRDTNEGLPWYERKKVKGEPLDSYIHKEY